MKNLLITLLALAVGSTAAIAQTHTRSFTTRVVGHGQPMILIPGLACPGAVWDSTVADFSRNYECHVLSIAGFAGAAPTLRADEPLIGTVTHELADYIREHRLSHPVLVGHSLGGFIALEFAIQNPDTPKALVIVDSLPFLMGIMQPNATVEDARKAVDAIVTNFGAMTHESYAQMIRSGPNGSTMAAAPADLDRIIAWGLASDPATVSKAMRELYTTDLRADVAAIKVPTEVFGAWIAYAPYSNHDIATRLYSGQYAKLNAVKIQISDTARHFIMFDDPHWLASQMHAFLGDPVSSAR